MKAGSRLDDTQSLVSAQPTTLDAVPSPQHAPVKQTPLKPPQNNAPVASTLLNSYASSSRQNQSKRQREWVYLSHYLMISGLNPLHIISGKDDGREPDFTLIFYRQSRLYYVGIELTTLPRLWDQMGETALIAKRWYWQGLQAMAKQQQQQASYLNFRLPVKTLYMSTDSSNKRLCQLPRSQITQIDIEAAMQKKAHKVSAYHKRRPLDELWLLIHTDKYQCQQQYQPSYILAEPAAATQLSHSSNFDQVHITRYPSHKLIEVIPRLPRAVP
jgi:hypothetical protein